MPMGLINVPATFMQTMNNLFSNMLDFSVTLFLYYIFVYSHMVKEHFALLKKVLECLYQYIFYYKLKKCSSLYNITTLLSFDITKEGI